MRSRLTNASRSCPAGSTATSPRPRAPTTAARHRPGQARAAAHRIARRWHRQVAHVPADAPAPVVRDEQHEMPRRFRQSQQVDPTLERARRIAGPELLALRWIVRIQPLERFLRAFACDLDVSSATPLCLTATNTSAARTWQKPRSRRAMRNPARRPVRFPAKFHRGCRRLADSGDSRKCRAHGSPAR